MKATIQLKLDNDDLEDRGITARNAVETSMEVLADYWNKQGVYVDAGYNPNHLAVSDYNS